MNRIIAAGAAALLIAGSSNLALAQGAGGGGGAGAGTVAQPGGPGNADQMKDHTTGMTHETPSTTGSTGMTKETPSASTTESSDIKGQRPSPVEGGGGAGGGGGR
ncbi:hypothetical protein JOD31_000818 [Methylopila capsulata]|uniref:Uncharacterized protein n=1 Tax=Methylopila capsulata TaxID=61654 RepID=A0A9W6MRN0_9HYPH|nr:hypothetical protein [Methylopila capsulata]MBM7850606.1 hypothetical protein [Methylopila capsulata]GLK55900.1 hypothetical protein GCM10008170_19190 [Methylopila capsulata]